VKFKPHKGIIKSHEVFLELEKLHDKAVNVFLVEIGRMGCEAKRFGLERRYSKKWYYADYRPDFKVECRGGRKFLVDVKAKIARGVADISEIKHTYANVRHVKGYLKASKETGLEVWLFIVFFDEFGYMLGHKWFNVNKIEWDKLEKARMWDGNLVYVIPLSLSSTP